MTKCNLCKQDIKPGTPAIESVGGFFDPEDPQFFVIDDGIMCATPIHLECFVDRVLKTKSQE